MPTKTTPNALEIQAALRLLYIERALAEIEGLSSDASYMADLNDDIDSHRNAFVGAVVTEIATLRGQLTAPLQG